VNPQPPMEQVVPAVTPMQIVWVGFWLTLAMLVFVYVLAHTTPTDLRPPKGARFTRSHWAGERGHVRVRSADKIVECWDDLCDCHGPRPYDWQDDPDLSR